MDNLTVVVLHVMGKGRENQGDAFGRYSTYQEAKSGALCPPHSHETCQGYQRPRRQRRCVPAPS